MVRMISETIDRHALASRLGNDELPHIIYFEMNTTLGLYDWPLPDHLDWIKANYPDLRTNIPYNEFNHVKKGDDVDFEIHTASFLYFIQFKDPKIALHFKLSFS